MKKLLTLLFCMVLLVGTVSALEFDNVKSYDYKTKTITIKNIFGLGNAIAEVKLNTPLNYNVPRGYQKVAEFELNVFSDYKTAFKELELYDKTKGMNKFNREYDYKYKTIKQVLVNDYKNICLDTKIKNGSIMKECEKVKIGSHYEEKEDWVKFDILDFKKNDKLIIGIFTNVKKGDRVEWIPNLFGVRIEEWATWTESLSTDLLAFYNMDKNSENFVSSKYDGLDKNITYGAGKIANGSVFSGASSEINISNDEDFYFGTGEWTVNFWVNTTSPIEEGFVGTYHPVDDTGWMIYSDVNSEMKFRNGGDLTFSTGYIIPGNTWVMITMTRNATHWSFYANGDLKAIISASNALNTNNNNLTWGGVKTASVTSLTGTLDEAGIWNRSISASEISDLYNGGDGISYTSSPEVNLNSPANNTNQNTNNLTFNCSATDNNGVLNLSLIINDGINYTVTNSSANQNLSLEQTINFSDGNYNWTCNAYDDDGLEGLNETRAFTIDTLNPMVNITFPKSIIDYHLINTNLSVVWEISDLNIDTCLLEYAGINNTLNCVDNLTYLNITNYDNRNITLCVNDTSGNMNCSFKSWEYKIFGNNISHNTTSYQTKSETFKINITANSSLTSVALEYNGTEYSTTNSGDIYSTTLDIPIDTLGNKTVRWKFTYSSETIYSNYSYQNISEIVWTLCNATYADDFLNISFKDEVNSTSINASIPTSTFVYYLGSGTVTKTYTFINISDNNNYKFCATPDLIFNVDSYVQYKQGTTYPQRIYDPSVTTYNSTVENKVLYLLASGDGSSVTFQVKNSASQGISSVTVTGTRIISGETITVANGLTDSAGTVNFFLNSNFQHNFTFSKTGYTTTTFLVTPTESAYTITLGGGVPAESDCTRGVSYSTNPSSSFLDQNTNYNFSYSISSSYWSLSKFNASLYYGNGTLISSDSSTTDVGGILSFNNINTTNQTSMYLVYAYEVNDSLCISISKNWIIQSTEGRDYSIWKLLTQINEYLDADLYGVKGDIGDNNFSRIVIAFLIIVLVTGVSIREFGIQSESFILSIVFSIVAILDVGLSFIPRIQVGEWTAIPYFVTVVTFIMWIAFLVKER